MYELTIEGRSPSLFTNPVGNGKGSIYLIKRCVCDRYCRIDDRWEVCEVRGRELMHACCMSRAVDVEHV